MPALALAAAALPFQPLADASSNVNNAWPLLASGEL
jgi:hypothetical protein